MSPLIVEKPKKVQIREPNDQTEELRRLRAQLADAMKQIEILSRYFRNSIFERNILAHLHHRLKVARRLNNKSYFLFCFLWPLSQERVQSSFLHQNFQNWKFELEKGFVLSCLVWSSNFVSSWPIISRELNAILQYFGFTHNFWALQGLYLKWPKAFCAKKKLATIGTTPVFVTI